MVAEVGSLNASGIKDKDGSSNRQEGIQPYPGNQSIRPKHSFNQNSRTA
jgi:hypothetical protein